MHGVVGHMPAHHAGQPAALHRNGLIHAPPELVFENLRTAMPNVKPGSEAVAEITGILGPSRRKH